MYCCLRPLNLRPLHAAGGESNRQVPTPEGGRGRGRDVDRTGADGGNSYVFTRSEGLIPVDLPATHAAEVKAMLASVSVA